MTTTASGLGFVGGGDGILRAFDVKTGNVLWKFQTGFQIAVGRRRSTRSNGNEYVAITVGGTTTSSNGGTVASQLQVFALGGSQTQSPAVPTIASQERQSTPRQRGRGERRDAGARCAASRARAPRRIVPPGPLAIQAWDPNTSNTQDVQGRVLLAGKPVAGVAVSVGRLGRAAPPTRTALFTYPADITMPGAARRHRRERDARDGRRQAADRGRAGAGCRREGRDQRRLLDLRPLDPSPGPEGTVVVTGRLTLRQGPRAAARCRLYSYELTGTVTDANGTPVKGAVVTTRTNDHKFWTFSAPTGREREVHVVPRRGRPGGRRPGPDDGRGVGRRGRVRRAAERHRELRRR